MVFGLALWLTGCTNKNGLNSKLQTVNREQGRFIVYSFWFGGYGL
jgi:hypothetical protein